MIAPPYVFTNLRIEPAPDAPIADGKRLYWFKADTNREPECCHVAAPLCVSVNATVEEVITETNFALRVLEAYRTKP